MAFPRKTLPAMLLESLPFLSACSSPSLDSPSQTSSVPSLEFIVVGDSQFKQDFDEVIAYLAQTPHHYAFVQEHIHQIEQAPYSEFHVDAKRILLGPSFLLPSESSLREQQIKYDVSCLIHDAEHQRLYTQWLAAFHQGNILPHFYAGSEGERQAIEVQAQYLLDVNWKSPEEINTWKEDCLLMGYWNVPREKRDW